MEEQNGELKTYISERFKIVHLMARLTEAEILLMACRDFYSEQMGSSLRQAIEEFLQEKR